jgi:hypothetical protein
MTNDNDLTTAHTHLETSLEHLVAARDAALEAEPLLTDARAARAQELVDKLTEAIAFTERLSTVVKGDCRASQAELLQ